MLEVIFRDNYISVQIKEFTMANAKHKAIADMLTKANFSHEAPGLWQQVNDLPKWYKQCEALVAKVGGEIIDRRGEPVRSPEPETKSDDIDALSPSPPDLETRIATLEAEVKRLGEIGAIASAELQQLEQLLKQLS